MIRRYKTIELRVVRKVRVYDADTSIYELVKESLVNFAWGFTANFMTPFIASRKDAWVFLSLAWYYLVISFVLNREKYTTNLGKYIVMPFPAAIGAYLAYKAGYVIIDWIK